MTKPKNDLANTAHPSQPRNLTFANPDRIVFRGHLRTLAYVLGMTKYLQRIGCLLKDFGEHAQAMTEELILRSL